MRLKHVSWQFPGMRKPDEFVIYPVTDPTRVKVQGARSIGVFDPATRKGVINYRGNTPKYGVHLSARFGAELIDFPEEFVRQVMAAIPRSGDDIGVGVSVAEHTMDLSGLL